MWRWSAVIFIFLAMIIAYYTIPHYVTGTSQFELIVTDFKSYLLGSVILGVAAVILLRD